jgi:two-component system phosphate regulon response regulator PhoB
MVDNDPDTTGRLTPSFKANGYRTQIVTKGYEAIRLTKTRPVPDLFMIDLDLPDLSGVEVCKGIRESQYAANVPIIILTSRGEEVDRVVGFEVGADDYVLKPFSVREVLLRVRAVLRRANRTSIEPTKGLKLPDLEVNREAHQVWVEGKETALTVIELKLLVALMERQGRLQARAQLLETVWKCDPSSSTRTVDTHIKRLREKLGPASKHIETIRGAGYRFR